MPRVAIVILNYNGKAFLELFLPSVLKYSRGYDVVVADNASTDQSVDLVKKFFPQVQLLEFDENYGYCGGYNRALAQLEADFFAIINSDIEVTENWIDPILQLFKSDKQIAAIQPKLLDYHKRDRFEYAGGAGGFIDSLGYPFCRGRLFETIEKDHGQYDDDREIFWSTGACFFIRAELFKKYGGFDESFFAHMEEIDLCWRMKKEGYKILHCGKSTVYHVGGGTLAYANPRKTYLNFRNSLMVLIKNLPANELFWKLPTRWLVDYVAILKFVLTGKVKDALMILKAHLYIIRNFFSTFKKRPSRDKNRFNATGLYKKWILFDYHVAGVRKFEDLKF